MMTDLSFEAYLESKKIDPGHFKINEPSVWEEWKHIFEQVSPKSFTAQKLFYINMIRRKYPLNNAASETPMQATKKRPRVVIKPKK